jgi:hypothetical protein
VKINIWPYKYPQNSQEENEKKNMSKKKFNIRDRAHMASQLSPSSSATLLSSPPGPWLTWWPSPSLHLLLDEGEETREIALSMYIVHIPERKIE